MGALASLTSAALFVALLIGVVVAAYGDVPQPDGDHQVTGHVLFHGAPSASTGSKTSTSASGASSNTGKSVSWKSSTGSSSSAGSTNSATSTNSASTTRASSKSSSGKASSTAPPPVLFNETLSLAHLDYAYAAYCNVSTVVDWTCAWCGYYGSATFHVQGTIYDAGTDTFGFIGYDAHANSILTVFRGTVLESLQNWISDLKAIVLQPYPLCSGCQVGDGFLRAYTSVQNQTVALFASTRKRYPSAASVFVGHSLGGAVAMLAALDLVAQFSLVDPVLYTFGNPRVGNAAFASYSNGVFAGGASQRMVWMYVLIPFVLVDVDLTAGVRVCVCLSACVCGVRAHTHAPLYVRLGAFGWAVMTLYRIFLPWMPDSFTS